MPGRYSGSAGAEPLARAPSRSAGTEVVLATFATRTLAEIYVRQGHLEQALSVYDQLLEASPDDTALRADRERVITTLRGDRETRDRRRRVERLQSLLERVTTRRRSHSGDA